MQAAGFTACSSVATPPELMGGNVIPPPTHTHKLPFCLLPQAAGNAACSSVAFPPELVGSLEMTEAAGGAMAAGSMVEGTSLARHRFAVQVRGEEGGGGSLTQRQGLLTSRAGQGPLP